MVQRFSPRIRISCSKIHLVLSGSVAWLWHILLNLPVNQRIRLFIEHIYSIASEGCGFGTEVFQTQVPLTLLIHTLKTIVQQIFLTFSIRFCRVLCFNNHRFMYYFIQNPLFIWVFVLDFKESKTSRKITINNISNF